MAMKHGRIIILLIFLFLLACVKPSLVFCDEINKYPEHIVAIGYITQEIGHMFVELGDKIEAGQLTGTDLTKINHLRTSVLKELERHDKARPSEKFFKIYEKNQRLLSLYLEILQNIRDGSKLVSPEKKQAMLDNIYRKQGEAINLSTEIAVDFKKMVR